MGNFSQDPGGLRILSLSKIFSHAGWTALASPITSLRLTYIKYKNGKLNMLVFISGHLVQTSYSIPGLGRSPGEGHDNTLQYSCLEVSMDRGGWQAAVHSVTQSQTMTEVTQHSQIAKPGSESSKGQDWMGELGPVIRQVFNCQPEMSSLSDLRDSEPLGSQGKSYL